MVVLFVCTILYRRPYIVLTSAKGETHIFHSHEGDVFYLSYIHSVNQSPVTEVFEIRRGQIVLKELEFETFGAGMPTEVEPGQELVHLPGGGMRIINFNRVIGYELRVMIAYETEQVFLFGDTFRVPLYSVSEPGQTVSVMFHMLNVWRRVYLLHLYC